MKRNLIIFLLIISIIITLSLFYIYNNYNFDQFEEYVSVNSFFDKISYEKKNFLSQSQCKKLSKFLLNHKLLTSNKLSESFNNSRGIVIKFKKNENLEKYFIDNNLKYIYEIFKKIKLKNTNAFIFNVLIIKTENKYKDHSNVQVDYHYDDTLDIMYNNKSIMPYQITVIYIHLPKKFKNGELIINSFCCKNVAKIIKPKIGKIINFRGDSLHKVNKIFSKKKDYRISLVFEQYNIPKEKLIDVPNFEII